MPDWSVWAEMARESLEAAGLLKDTAPRSSASRYYYAAYQAASCVLLYRGLLPPVGREAWSHEDTPGLLVTNLAGDILKRGQREDLKSRLARLYKVRVSADYISADDVASQLERVRKDAEFLVKVVQGIVS